MMKFFRVIKEIKNYRIYKKILKKESMDSKKWSKFRLRIDWLYRVYTVINLPPTITRSPDFPREARPAYVMEEVSAINDYLGIELNLNELMTLSMEEIKEVNGDSFLVVWHFLFRELSLFYVFKFISSLVLITLVILNLDFIIEYLTLYYNMIIN